jgi:hypothetical protein
MGECVSIMVPGQSNLTPAEFALTLQGPDTSALSFRIGLHSGPVTGGVLRGENARFQLFGDVSLETPASQQIHKQQAHAQYSPCKRRSTLRLEWKVRGVQVEFMFLR